MTPALEPLAAGATTRPVAPIVRSDWIEALAVGCLGFAIMHFIYSGEIAASGGAPGVDSFYHVRMADMIPEHGWLKTFPWLRFCYFSEEGDAFVSHHHGFQVLLIPFLTLARWVGADALAGGRWAMCAFFGVSFVLLHLILVTHAVRWRWVWMLSICLLPAQFFGRHAFVRAPAPSLALMLLILLLIFRQRYLLAGLAVAAYNHLYLGGVLYAPVIVGAAAISCLSGSRDDRRELVPLIAWTAGGWFLGVLTHPYLGGMLEFLKLQVFGSGLSPDIEVGREWKPYEGLWWFAQMVGPLAALWATALAARLRWGPPLDRREFTVFLLNAGFLVLTFKARRFIEYWPAMAFLNAAMMAQPVLERWFARLSQPDSAVARLARWAVVPLTAVLLVAVWRGQTATAGRMPWAPFDLAPFAAEWRVWALLAAALLVVPMARVWATAPGVLTRWRASCATAAGCVVTAAVIARLGVWVAGDEQPHIVLPWFVTLAGAAVMALAAWFVQGRPLAEAAALDPRTGLRRMVGAVGVAAVVLLAAGPPLLARRSEVSCKYDLPKIRSAMDFLAAHSRPGDVVFTDDWDMFPVYFYYNTHNHYIVGLDPKFTQHRRPDLWERYVRITRGQTPAILPKALVTDGVPERIRLEDIRDAFGARFVVTDLDHRKLAGQLAKAPALAKLVYPAAEYASCRDAPYLIFEILAADGSDAPTEPLALPAELPLGYLTPRTVEQGWGDYCINAAVGGAPIRLNGRHYESGLGTHAPSRIVFDIPTGYETFSGLVGVDEGNGGDGSIVAVVELDGKEVYRSPTLYTGDAVAVTVPLEGAGQIILRAEPTADGQRFDHVSWAQATLKRGAVTRQRQPVRPAAQDPARGSAPAAPGHHPESQVPEQ